MNDTLIDVYHVYRQYTIRGDTEVRFCIPSTQCLFFLYIATTHMRTYNMYIYMVYMMMISFYKNF